MEGPMQIGVDKIFLNIIAVLGDTFSFEHLVDFTQLCRGKPLRVEQDNMPIAMTGYCIALLDIDLICTRRGLDPFLTRITCLHEIAHLLLWHIPLTSNGPSTPDYQTFLSNRDTVPRVKRIHSNQHDSQYELEAETLATLFADCITRYEESVPQLAHILGW